MKKFLSLICLLTILLNLISPNQIYAVWLEPKCAPYKCVDADYPPISTSQNGARCNVWGYGDAAWQNWIQISQVEGFTVPRMYWKFKNSANSAKCLDEDVHSFEVLTWDCHNGNNQQWYTWPAGDGYFYIINRATDHYLTASGSSDASPVKGEPNSGSDCQKWKIHHE